MISILEREKTPNPNAFKYHTNHRLVREGTLNFANEKESTRLPLAKALFDTGNVTAVMLAEDFVSVSGDEWVDWQEIEGILKAQLQSFDPEEASRQAEEAAERKRKAQEAGEPNEMLKEINQLIDIYVRPALAGDGGGLEVLGIDENKVVQVRYEGACGSCPSATMGTLNAIEALLRNKIDPEISLESAPVTH